MAWSLRSFRQVATLRYGHLASRFELFVAQMAGDEMSLPHIFQPVALEVQGSLDESSEIFITRLCKMLCRSHDNQRAGNFLKQLISMALQIGNAACVLGTVSDRVAFQEIYYI